MTIRSTSLSRLSAILLAGTALASPAFAQVTPPQDDVDATTGDEIVVTGQRDGGVLEHVETYGIEAERQAIDWDEATPGMLYGITRSSQEILAMCVFSPL